MGNHHGDSPISFFNFIFKPYFQKCVKEFPQGGSEQYDRSERGQGKIFGETGVGDRPAMESFEKLA